MNKEELAKHLSKMTGLTGAEKSVRPLMKTETYSFFPKTSTVVR